MAVIDQSQQITMQELAKLEEHVRFVTRNILLACIISKKKGINVNNGGDSTKGNDGGDVNTLLQSNFAEIDVKCASTGFPANIISMCIVPVKLSHAKTKKEVSTLSMLDKCSQGTFHGVLFTCLMSCAVHIEMTKTMDTDSFILALRRFIGRRGNVRSIRCDNGSNFMGAERELAKSSEEMDHRKIKHFLLNQKTDLIIWERNPPMASHMGGIWERQIRSARNILATLLRTDSSSLDEESLNTLFTEVEAIVNSRPLVVETNDVNSEVALSPSHLLTMKSKVVMPPPGAFGKPDLYCRRH